MGRKSTGHTIRLTAIGRSKKKEWSEDGEEDGEEEQRLSSDTERSVDGDGSVVGLDYVDLTDDYADDDSHEVEDNTPGLAILGAGLLGAGCFFGIPSCLGIPFLF